MRRPAEGKTGALAQGRRQCLLCWNGAWLDPNFRAWDISEYLAYIRVPVAVLRE